jgi:hypothetical protein
MRKIKFRVWDKILKRMLSWEWVHDNFFSRIFDYPNMIPMQYTGLKDKNGKEIYEGDIVNNGPLAPAWVEWLEEGAGFIFREVGSDEWWSPNGFSLVTEFAWEIIGNIYENPELLETK